MGKLTFDGGVYIYIYIYIERERERDIYIFIYVVHVSRDIHTERCLSV